MYISILYTSGIIIGVDEQLTTLLGQSAKNWIGKRPIDYLHQQDMTLFLSKLVDTSSKTKIEPFYLRFKKDNTAALFKLPDISSNNNNNNNNNDDDGSSSSSSASSNHSNDHSPRLIHYSGSNEYVAFHVELKADKVRVTTLESGSEKSGSATTLSKNNASSTGGTVSSENVNLKPCFKFNLRFPPIYYFDNQGLEPSFISHHDVNLKITKIENT
jgi:hypothetical protein